MNIYVASSWRNKRYPDIIIALQAAGHLVHDWRASDIGGFGWRDLDPDWQNWSPEKFRTMLAHPLAVAGFEADLAGMKQADVCVLLAPCGRSAHLEAGWFWGQGKPLFVLLAEGEEPELMYGGAQLVLDVDELLTELDKLAAKEVPLLTITWNIQGPGFTGLGWPKLRALIASLTSAVDVTEEQCSMFGNYDDGWTISVWPEPAEGGE